MTTDAQRTVTLASGNEMPSLGLGTWRLTGQAAKDGVEHALALGYRLIDTSGDYGNQPQIAAALKRAAVKRGDVYLVSKVEEDDDAYASARQKVDELGAEYLDLCLIHRPPPEGAGEGLWEGLLRARADGLARDVGVSNYTPDQIDTLIEATGEPPAVNQLEWSPFGYSDVVMDHARATGVVIQAYSPLTRGQRLDDPTVAEIAAEHFKTPAQVLLRWSLQYGAAPVPKAASAAHREQNVKVFDFTFSPDEMGRLSALNEHYSALAGLPYV